MTTPTTPPTPEPQDNPATPDSLADEVFVDDGVSTAAETTVLPTTDAPAAAEGTAAATATATMTAPAPAVPAVLEPQWIKGPAPFAVVLGILGLLLAGSVLVGELTDINLRWGDLGPWSVVLAGVVVLLVGAIGLRSSRSRD